MGDAAAAAMASLIYAGLLDLTPLQVAAIPLMRRARTW
jgi:hypothetical protein